MRQKRGTAVVITLVPRFSFTVRKFISVTYRHGFRSGAVTMNLSNYRIIELKKKIYWLFADYNSSISQIRCYDV